MSGFWAILSRDVKLGLRQASDELEDRLEGIVA